MFGSLRELFGSPGTNVSSPITIFSCFISSILPVFIENLSFVHVLLFLSDDFDSLVRKFSCLSTKSGTHRTNLDYKRGKKVIIPVMITACIVFLFGRSLSGIGDEADSVSPPLPVLLIFLIDYYSLS